MLCGFDFTHLVVQRPGPPPSRPPPRLTPSPDQRQQHAGLFEDEAAVPDANTDSASTTTQQVRLIILPLRPGYFYMTVIICRGTIIQDKKNFCLVG